MRRYEFLAERIEQVQEQTGVSRAEAAYLRNKYAILYRNAVGVRPESRHLLRQNLEQVAVQGDRTVDEVIAQTRTTEIDEWLSDMER